jgi:hypothetical protein
MLIGIGTYNIQRIESKNIYMCLLRLKLWFKHPPTNKHADPPCLHSSHTHYPYHLAYCVYIKYCVRVRLHVDLSCISYGQFTSRVRVGL